MSIKITAAVLRKAAAPFQIEEVELSEPRDNEILVRIIAVGLCHSDIAAQHQSLPVNPPVILGHEGAGIVERVGAAVTKVKPGDKVVLTFPYCGACENCRRGDVAYCENMVDLCYSGQRPDHSCTHSDASGAIAGHFFAQSSFASYALAYESNTVKMPDDAPIELIAPLGCGIQTGAGAVLNAIKAQAGRAIAIYGGGAVGISAVMAAKISGCNPIIVVEPVASRRQLASEVGATHAIDPVTQDIAQSIRAIIPRGTDYAVDSTGIAGVVDAALASMATHGTAVLLGVPKNPADSINVNLLGFLSSGGTLKAVIEGDSQPDYFIPQLYQYFRDGKLPLDKIVTTYPFSQINQAIDDQHRGKNLKAVLLLP